MTYSSWFLECASRSQSGQLLTSGRKTGSDKREPGSLRHINHRVKREHNDGRLVSETGQVHTPTEAVGVSNHMAGKQERKGSKLHALTTGFLVDVQRSTEIRIPASENLFPIRAREDQDGPDCRRQVWGLWLGLQRHYPGHDKEKTILPM